MRPCRDVGSKDGQWHPRVLSEALPRRWRELPFSGGGSKLPSRPVNVKTPENARKRWLLSDSLTCGVDPFGEARLSS